MLAAVAQICSTPSIVRNLALCQNVIRKAASRGAKVSRIAPLYSRNMKEKLNEQLVYLPEASDFIAPSSSVLSLSENLDKSSFVKGIKQQAKESRVWVGVGVHEMVSHPLRSIF